MLRYRSGTASISVTKRSTTETRVASQSAGTWRIAADSVTRGGGPRRRRAAESGAAAATAVAAAAAGDCGGSGVPPPPPGAAPPRRRALCRCAISRRRALRCVLVTLPR